MTYRLKHNGTHTKVTPDVYAEVASRGSKRSSGGRRIFLRLGDCALKMTPTDAVRLADALIDATEARPRPKKPKPKRLTRADHVKPTPATPAWTSASADYNHPDN